MTYRDNSDPDNVFVQLGTVDEPNDYKLQSHIFVANKASWYDIHDNVVQFPAYPGPRRLFFA